MTFEGVILMPLPEGTDETELCKSCHGAGAFVCEQGCHTIDCPNDCDEGYFPKGTQA